MNERELEELLRSRPEPLPPPSGRWEAVRRRARRRRMAKLSGAVLAGVVVVAGVGLGPRILFSHDHASEQRLSIAAPPPTGPLPESVAPAKTRQASSPSPTADPRATAPLGGFAPSSVSFVSQDEGFLLGSTGGSNAVLARTLDGGATWSPLATVPAAATSAAVRFATGAEGFVFGLRYLVTTDGGRVWQPEQAPGYIRDLETMNGHVYALVSSCRRCRPVSLFGATTASPALRRVTAVPAMAGDSVSLAVYKDAAYVLDTVKGGAGQVWATLDGTRWSQRPSPCGTTMGLISEWSATGLTAACDGRLYAAGRESKHVFVSSDGALTWSPLATAPTRSGYINSVSASGPAAVVVGDGRSGLDVTTDGGRHWTLRGPAMSDGAGFVGFIGPDRVVALPARPSDGLFTISDDTGLAWRTDHFPR